MFWNRKKQIVSSIGGLPLEIPPIPPKKEFVVMLDLLIDAEKCTIMKVKKRHVTLY